MALMSCGVDKQNNTPTGKGGFGDFKVIEVDHCEYLVYDHWEGSLRSFSVTHKGNCKNHKQNEVKGGQSSSINIDGTSGNQIEVNQGNK